MTLDEQYTCSFEDYKAEVSNRKSGMIPWHRLPAEVWQEAHDNKPVISELVQKRAIRPVESSPGFSGNEESERLRWIQEAHPVGHRAPIPDSLFWEGKKIGANLGKGGNLGKGERGKGERKPTFLLDRTQAKLLIEHVQVWEEVGSFLDRQRARFKLYWKNKPIRDFLDAFQGNFGLDDNQHAVCDTTYMASYYLDRHRRYSICIMIPFALEAGERDLGEEERGKGEKGKERENMTGPPVYYCYTCLCGSS
jgi:hypothetical protein